MAFVIANSCLPFQSRQFLGLKKRQPQKDCNKRFFNGFELLTFRLNKGPSEICPIIDGRQYVIIAINHDISSWKCDFNVYT